MSIVPDPYQYIKGFVSPPPMARRRFPQERGRVLPEDAESHQPVQGMGIIQSIMTDIQSEKASAEWNRLFFVNGGSVGDTIECPGTVSNEDYERLRSQYRSGHEGCQMPSSS